MGDLERLAGRACAGHASPRDLIAIAEGLKKLPRLKSIIELFKYDLPDWTDQLKNIDSGLSNAVKVLKDTDGIGFTRFLSRDVVRHPLVRKIIDAYEYFEEKVKTK